MTNEYKRYLNSKKWLKIRLDVIQTREKCERCGSIYKLEVHHLTYDNIFNERPEDLELLCKSCHSNEHHIKSKNRKHKKRKKKRKPIIANKKLTKAQRIRAKMNESREEQERFFRDGY